MADAVRLAPRGWFSEAVGWGARRRVPRALRRPFYTAFSRWYGVRLEEVELPLEEYPSFGSFFARRLRPGSRPQPAEDDAIIAPCDSVVAASGEAHAGRLIQAKGKDYSLAALLVDEVRAAELTGGAYVTYYLSPKDYHRVHTPVAGKVLGYDYVPGELFPVSPLFVDQVDELFARNERVVIHMDTASGPAAVVMVGATGVGNMEVSYGPGEPVHSRHYRGEGAVQVRHDPIEVERGDELGAFHLGSTVIVVFSRGSAQLEEDLVAGASVRFGQIVARTRAGGPIAAAQAAGSNR